jgi:thymidylate synthase
VKQYNDALKYVYENGKDRSDRTGVGTRSVFGMQMRFDLQESFPAVTTKKLAWKSVVSELLWFLEGSTDERRLAEIHYGKPREELVGKQTIWTANADNQGVALGYTNTDLIKELGPVYGAQWRSWKGSNGPTDQLAQLINQLKTNPDSRRHILSAWNVQEVPNMALPPCHTLAQFYVHDNTLSCQLYQRSADMPLGSPFNIASYALLTHMVAQICKFDVGDFVYTLGDAHIYHNQFDGVKEQISRESLTGPKLIMPEFSTLDEISATSVADYKLENYTHHPEIKFPFAI